MRRLMTQLVIILAVSAIWTAARAETILPSSIPKPVPKPNPLPNPANSCPQFRGVFSQHDGSVFEIEQKDCSELKWQDLANDFKTPLGPPDVYLMDGIEHPVGNLMVSSSYQADAFVLESHILGQKISLSYKIVRTGAACGQHFFIPQTILLQTIYINGIEDQGICQYWPQSIK